MKRITVVLSLLAGILLSGCCAPGLLPNIAGSGKLVTRELDLTGFSRLSAGSAFEIEVTRGEPCRVVVTADENLIDYVDASVAGDTLQLRLQPGRSYRNATLKAQVTMPKLQALSLSGAGRCQVSGFEGIEPLDINLSGASALSGSVQAGDVTVETSGASSLALQGSGQDLSLGGSGASSADLGSFSVRDAQVRLSGASNATVKASGTLSGNLSGGSRLSYAGNPTLGHIKQTGGSSISAR